MEKLYDILADFKDGRDAFVKGERRALDRERAEKLAKRGWVAVEGVTPGLPVIGQSLTLDVHNGRLGHNAQEMR